MTDQPPLTWPELNDFQSRVVSRRPALSHGVPVSTAADRIKSGAWQRLQRGTYATFSGLPPREACLWAAVLRAGPGAVLSHETAAEVHGFAAKPSSKIHVTVSFDRNPARWGDISGVIIHRSRNVASQPLPPWQLPRTPIAETVLDLVAASETFDDAYAWLSRATGRQLATVEMIRDALAGRKRMRLRSWLAEALDVADIAARPRQWRSLPRQLLRAVPAVRRARRQVQSSPRTEVAGHRSRQRQPLPRRRPDSALRHAGCHNPALCASAKTSHAVHAPGLGWGWSAALR